MTAWMEEEPALKRNKLKFLFMGLKAHASTAAAGAAAFFSSLNAKL
jgi:hypothetical protein